MNEKQYKQKLVTLGCMVCRRLYGITDSPVQLHHFRSGGWGRGDYTTLIPLCYPHHLGKDGIHTLGTKFWEKQMGFTQKDLLLETQKEMNDV